MKKGNMIWVDMAVVAAIVLFLILIFFPSSLRHPPELSYRVQCSMQINGILKSMVLYSNDYQGKFPVVGSAGEFGQGLYNRPGEDKYTRWYDPEFKDWNGQTTVGGTFYLLIKYCDIVPKMFICPSSTDRSLDLELAIKLAREKGWKETEDYTQLNDFYSMANLSYSLNDPWAAPITDESSSGLAVVADKSNGYATLDGSFNKAAGEWPVQNKNGTWTDCEGDNPRAGNSPNHKSQCQNVGYADSHVRKEDTPLAGIKQDNIYTRWLTLVRPDPTVPGQESWNRGHAAAMEDSYLGN